MTPRHLTALLAATIAFAVGTTATLIYGHRVEARYIHTLGHPDFTQKTLGAALQAEAFRQPDLLPIYGSSEIVYDDPFHALRLFVNYPTGFQVFPVASRGATPLMYAQRLAAVGSAMRGRKVAISIGPISIYGHPENARAAYAGNFSRLQATALAFSLQLPYRLRQTAARRMMHYPTTLADDVLLRTALRALADESLESRALYTVLVPLGKLQEWTLRLLDHWEVLANSTALANRLEPLEPRAARALDWQTLTSSAQRVAEDRSNTNPFGFDNDAWIRSERNAPVKRRTTVNPVPTLRHVASRMKSRDESDWIDLDLLFWELESFGAKPLVLSAPFNGRYYDFWGVNQQARRTYYETLREIAARHHVPVLDFEDHDQDNHFVTDSMSHLSAKAWIYYDRALDEFFHDEPLTQTKQELPR